MKSTACILKYSKVLFTLALATIAPAALAVVDTRIDGLPPGLSVSVVANQVRCNSNGVQYVPVSRLTLAERGIPMWESVPAALGGMTLVQRTRTSYVGQWQLPTLPASGCDSIPQTVTFNVVVLGDQSGPPGFRSGYMGSTSSPGTFSTLHHTMEAKTISLTTRGGVPGYEQNIGAPTALVRGQWQTWFTSHRNSMGESSVVDPTLEFLYEPSGDTTCSVLFSRCLVSRGRISIRSDGLVCVRLGSLPSSTVCRTREQGLLVNGNIEVDTQNTKHDQGYTTWRFRLTAFPAGSIVVRAAANDLDTIDYLVDGVPTALNLLPWKSLELPVLIN